MTIEQLGLEVNLTKVDLFEKEQLKPEFIKVTSIFST